MLVLSVCNNLLRSHTKTSEQRARLGHALLKGFDVSYALGDQTIYCTSCPNSCV